MASSVYHEEFLGTRVSALITTLLFFYVFVVVVVVVLLLWLYQTLVYTYHANFHIHSVKYNVPVIVNTKIIDCVLVCHAVH